MGPDTPYPCEFPVFSLWPRYTKSTKNSRLSPSCDTSPYRHIGICKMIIITNGKLALLSLTEIWWMICKPDGSLMDWFHFVRSTMVVPFFISISKKLKRLAISFTSQVPLYVLWATFCARSCSDVHCHLFGQKWRIHIPQSHVSMSTLECPMKEENTILSCCRL